VRCLWTQLTITGTRMVLRQERNFLLHQRTLTPNHTMSTTKYKPGKLAIFVSVNLDNINAHYTVSTLSFEHLFQCTNKPMLTIVHSFQFIQFMTWNNSLFSCWSYKIESLLHKLSFDTSINSFPVTPFQLSIGNAKLILGTVIFKKWM
jgi:hypothetical protein